MGLVWWSQTPRGVWLMYAVCAIVHYRLYRFALHENTHGKELSTSIYVAYLIESSCTYCIHGLVDRVIFVLNTYKF